MKPDPYWPQELAEWMAEMAEQDLSDLRHEEAVEEIRRREQPKLLWRRDGNIVFM
jgi:hypothetical protein